MVTKLELYNKALSHLGPERLDPTLGLTENRPDRYELDARYDGVKREMLEHGLWRFAIRTYEATPDPNIVPSFGPAYGYNLPDDFVRLHAIALDPNLIEEDRGYRREGSVIYSTNSRLYISIVSDDAALGGDLGAYTELFAEAFGLLLANKACVAITKDQNLETKLLRKFETVFLPRAKRKDAVDERVKEKPMSSWLRTRFANSRQARYGGRIA